MASLIPVLLFVLKSIILWTSVLLSLGKNDLAILVDLKGRWPTMSLIAGKIDNEYIHIGA